MALTVFAPYRPDGGWRDRLWEFAHRTWGDARVVTDPGPDGEFSRSGALNAAAACHWDVALFVDADAVLSQPIQAEYAVERAQATQHLTYAFDWRAALTEDGTRGLLNGDVELPWAEIERFDPHSFSSCVAVPRQLWDQVGGFDERFVGWGFEDLAFMRACGTFGGGIERIPGVIYHLWHIRDRAVQEDNPHYSHNERLWHEYERAGWSPARMRKVLTR